MGRGCSSINARRKKTQWPPDARTPRIQERHVFGGHVLQCARRTSASRTKHVRPSKRGSPRVDCERSESSQKRNGWPLEKKMGVWVSRTGNPAFLRGCPHGGEDFKIGFKMEKSYRGNWIPSGLSCSPLCSFNRIARVVPRIFAGLPVRESGWLQPRTKAGSSYAHLRMFVGKAASF